MEKEEIIRLIVAHGMEETLDICMEECSELSKAITKLKRSMRSGSRIAVKKCRKDLVEECADVIICIKILCELYNIPEKELYTTIYNKMELNLARIGV